MMNAFRLIICLFVFHVSFSQTKNYETGKIINSIDVKGATEETFALYLPKSFDKQNGLHAIVIIFDPSGKGANGIKPFVSSAEKFNYILVCSNNSKNGPYEMNFDIANRLFSHVFSEFNIDENQFYTAGFSGGSRLASTIAVLTGAVQGVIGCGAGFSNDFQNTPNADSKFSYVGLVGDEDMNYQEMFNAKIWLEKLNVDNEFFTYNDGHNWPPEVQIERAFSWIELQAYKKNLRPKDTLRIKDFYKANAIIADSLSKNYPFKAVMEYDRIAENYDSYFKLDSIHQKREAIKTSKAYKDDVKIRRSIADTEYKLSEKFLTRFRQESAIGESKDNFAWWKKELKKLENDISKKNDYHTNKMDKRLRFRLLAVAYESSVVFGNSKRLDKVLYCEKLLTTLYPDRSYWHYKLAETYAKTNDAKKARAALKTAVEKGFENLDLIKLNPLFLKFKDDKKFAEFLSSLN